MIKVEKKGEPHAGIYGNDLVYQAYVDLIEEVNRFIPDHDVSGTIRGTKGAMVTKAEMILNKAKNLKTATKAVRDA